ncbi:MAG TPA: leucyl/phenylalanyl-tRNA--protein transferase [Planctomycetota bacterium]|jgi:leucyl/phenylalanyl-tRNA--protein transferase
MKLTPAMLIAAYSNGIFPMDEWGRLSWYQPDPRAILPLDKFHASHSLSRTLRKGIFEITYDTDFEGVMRGCASRKPTWISEAFIQVYTQLHRLGHAHSVEVRQKGMLVGGTYGVHLGGAFCAESKFHTVTDASKVALAKLVERLNERGFKLLEVQYLTEHLAQFGVIEIPHAEYMKRLQAALKLKCTF